MRLIADSIAFGQAGDSVAGLDAFVLITLGFLGFLFGVFVVAAVVLWRRESRPSPDRQLLIDLEQDDTSPQSAPSHAGDDEAGPPQPWEREADWWKKQ